MAKKKKFQKLDKKKGRGFCDELWAMLVKIRYNHRCPICVANGLNEPTELANAHHLISRRVFKYRWDTDNGVLLCPKHHEFDLIISAHTAPWAFEEWIRDNEPIKYANWVSNRKDISTDESAEYDVIYESLEEEHKIITGQYYRPERISNYKLFKNSEEILFAIKMQGAKSSDLISKYGVTKVAMDKFLKEN